MLLRIDALRGYAPRSGLCSAGRGITHADHDDDDDDDADGNDEDDDDAILLVDHAHAPCRICV